MLKTHWALDRLQTICGVTPAGVPLLTDEDRYHRGFRAYERFPRSFYSDFLVGDLEKRYVLVGMSYLYVSNSLLGCRIPCWLILSAKILLVNGWSGRAAIREETASRSATQTWRRSARPRQRPGAPLHQVCIDREIPMGSDPLQPVPGSGP